MLQDRTAVRTSSVTARRAAVAPTIARSTVLPQQSPARALQQRLGNHAAHALVARSTADSTRAATARSIYGPSAASSPNDRLEHTQRYTGSVDSVPAILRKCACNGTCPSCGKGNETLQRKALGSTSQADYTALSRHSHDAGRPLDAATRAFMEAGFGDSFDGVRVHTDDFASGQAHALGASAFTIGQDIFFGSGQYQPETHAGRRLIAHELTHTLQQRGSTRRADALGPHAVSQPSDALELEADRIAARVVNGEPVQARGTADAASIARDVSFPSVGDLKRGAQAVYDAGKGVVQQGAQAIKGAAQTGEEIIEWIATEAGQAAIAEANALAGLLGGSVIIRKGCVVITVPEITIFPSFQKTLAESPPVGVFLPVFEGGVLIGPIPLVGMAGLLAYGQLSAEAAVGPGVVRGISFEICPFSRRAAARAQLYAAAAIAPRLTLFGGIFGALGTAIPTTPPVPIIVIAQAGLRATGTGWAIGAIQDTVLVEYRGGTIHFSNIAELMLGYLLQGDLDFFAALRLYTKIICQYVHPIKHWETGRAGKLTIPIKASYGGGGGSGSIGPITWGPMPIGDIQTAIRPLPTGWNCLSWQEIKEFLCERKVLPRFLCDEEGELEDLKKKEVTASGICKCVGDADCGGGARYKVCFKTQKDCKKAQKDGDDFCNNNREMKEKCIRPKCYYRHTQPKCPDKCDPGTIEPLEGPLATKAVRVTIGGGTELWHFDGATPPSYPVRQTLTATATPPTAGSFTWTMTSGAAFADFSGSPIAVGPVVLLRSKSGSAAINDVQLKVDFAGAGGETGTDSVKMTVRVPQSMTRLGNTGSSTPFPPANWSNFVSYSIQDQFGTTLPRNVPINEQWTNKPPVAVFPGTNWPSFPPTEGSATVNPAKWSDNVAIRDGKPPVLIPTPRASGAGGPLIQRFAGHWRVGDLTTGVGRRALSVTWRFFQDHGDHL